MRKFIKLFVLVIIISLFTGSLVYFLRPNTASVLVFPFSTEGRKQFSCSIKMGATLFPEPNYEKHTFETVQGSLFNNDKTKMAIEINGKELKMLTAQAVELGMTEPAKLLITKETDAELIAVDLETDVTIDQGVGTFVLNKKTGTAVWTKSKPAFIASEIPNAQAYFMECR